MNFLPHLQSPEWSGPAHLSRAPSALLPSSLLQHFPICPTRNFTNILSQSTSPALSDSLLLTLTSPFKWHVLGFPGGAVVGSLPASAGDAGSSPGLGRSHMPRSGWAREPQLLSLRVWSLCPAAGGAAIVKGPRTAMKSGPRTAMRSGPHLP